MISSEAGHQDVVKILLAAGANIEAVTSLGMLGTTLTVRVDDIIFTYSYLLKLYACYLGRLDSFDDCSAPRKR
jgi:hypothetical protein